MNARSPHRTKRRQQRPGPGGPLPGAGWTRHTAALLATEDGWQIIDQNGATTEVIETLRDPRDEREQAEAVARDYADWAAVPALTRQ